MPDKPSVLKRRIAPTVPLTIEVPQESGTPLKLEFRLAFDFNVLARIEQRTGIKMLGLNMWTSMSASVLSVALWAACLSHSPEYNTKDDEGKETDEGLIVIRSYLDDEASDRAADALWEAYMLYVPPAKRELLRKIRSGEKTDPTQVQPTNESTSTGQPSTPSPDSTSVSASTNSAS